MTMIETKTVIENETTPETLSWELGEPSPLKSKGFLGVDDVSASELQLLLDTAEKVKQDPSWWAGALQGKSAVMLFEKPSLRTRITFEVGLAKLGAHVCYFDHKDKRIGERESIKDYGRNLERWVDLVIARVFEHKTLTGIAEHCDAPVINALSELEHPCQMLADFLTLKETFGTLKGLKIAYLGDGNNVCHSLVLAAAKLGVDMTIVTPKGFEPQFSVLGTALKSAEQTGAKILVTHDVQQIAGHHAVYTDTWLSMGQDHQNAIREGRFGHLQVDEELMALASQGLGTASKFMHCLPAHRGEEVTDEVIDSGESVVYDQAENRLHAQVALMLHLLAG